MLETLANTYVASIAAPADAAEALAAALEAAETPAAMAVTLFDQGNGNVEVSAHYADEPNRAALVALLGVAWDGGEFGALRIERIAPQDWISRSESLRRPVRAGRFLVHGRHDRGRVPHLRQAIEIDAGLAFGTAHHATTRGCLIALDRIAKREHPRRVLDIGTGSGILAIAAAKVTNGMVLASDMDPIAAAVAADNVRRNRVHCRVRVVRAEGLAHQRVLNSRADLLFANLLLRPLLDLAPAFARALRPGGACILSGLLDSQARQVEARFRSLGFKLDSRILLDGWTTLVLRRGNR
jgi:ribosomal protein L11 methyltransferase